MIIEVWLLGVAAILLTTNNGVRKLFLISLVADTIIWATIIMRHSIYLFANVPMVAGCCIITALYIYVLFNKAIFYNNKILNQPIFWLSISTVLYFGCDIPYMGLHNYMAQHVLALAKKLDYINRILDIIRYPLVAISFILLGRQQHVALKGA